MTGFIASISELFILIFQSLRLPMLLPALVFATVDVLYVIPGFRRVLMGQSYLSLNETDQTLLLIMITLLTAYALNTLNLTIIRWFEGYPLVEMGIWPGSFLLKLHQNYFRDLENKRIELETKLSRTFKQVGKKDPNILASQQELAITLTKLSYYYPTNLDRVAPTQLGNILASAEDQPYYLYRMDAIALWPLLVPILTKEGFSKFLEQEKASLDFLLNSLLVIVVIGIEMLGLGIFTRLNWETLVLESAIISLACLLLYHLSLQGAIGWGHMIRTAFHLYHHELSQELKLKGYKDLKDERRVWEKASVFYRGPTGLKAGYDIFDYTRKDTQERQSSSK